MPEPITKLNDLNAVGRDIRNLYALLTKIQGDIESLAARISALESP